MHCRRAVRPGEVIPPIPEDGKPLDGEEELLDGNELAAGHDFFSLGTFRTSPDQRWLAYSTDFAGNERFTLRIKDLATGATLPDEIPDTFAGCAWSLDGSTVFYTTVDDAWRPYRVWRHRIGTPAEADTMVFEEPDERFHVYVSLTRSESYLMIKSASVLTSEVWLLDAATPSASSAWWRRAARAWTTTWSTPGDHLLILHNDGAENFEIATASLADPATWTPLVPHRADTRLLGVDAFADYTVVYFRRDGLTGLRILRQGRRARGRLRRAGLPGRAGKEPRVPGQPVPAVLHLAGDPGLGLRLRHGDRRAHPAQAPAGTPRAGRHRVPAGRLRAAPGVGGRRRRHPGADLAGVPQGHAAGRFGAVPALRLRQLRDLPGPESSPSRCCRCSTGVSSTRSRTSGAAARWAGPGTPTASCCIRRTRSPTSSRAPGTWPPRAGRRRTG